MKINYKINANGSVTETSSVKPKKQSNLPISPARMEAMFEDHNKKQFDYDEFKKNLEAKNNKDKQINEASKYVNSNTTWTKKSVEDYCKNYKDTNLAWQAKFGQKAKDEATALYKYSHGEQVFDGQAKLADKYTVTNHAQELTDNNPAYGVPLTQEMFAALNSEPASYVSKQKVYNILKEGYYLMYENGKAYLSKSNLEGTMPQLLIKQNTNEKLSLNNSTVFSINHGINTKCDNITNLTQAEFDYIVSSKPSFNSLLSVYRLVNQTTVKMDYKGSQVVFN